MASGDNPSLEAALWVTGIYHNFLLTLFLGRLSSFEKESSVFKIGPVRSGSSARIEMTGTVSVHGG